MMTYLSLIILILAGAVIMPTATAPADNLSSTIAPTASTSANIENTTAQDSLAKAQECYATRMAGYRDYFNFTLRIYDQQSWIWPIMKEIVMTGIYEKKYGAYWRAYCFNDFRNISFEFCLSFKNMHRLLETDFKALFTGMPLYYTNVVLILIRLIALPFVILANYLNLATLRRLMRKAESKVTFTLLVIKTVVCIAFYAAELFAKSWVYFAVFLPICLVSQLHAYNYSNIAAFTIIYGKWGLHAVISQMSMFVVTERAVALFFPMFYRTTFSALPVKKVVYALCNLNAAVLLISGIWWAFPGNVFNPSITTEADNYVPQRWMSWYVIISMIISGIVQLVLSIAMAVKLVIYWRSKSAQQGNAGDDDDSDKAKQSFGYILSAAYLVLLTTIICIAADIPMVTWIIGEYFNDLGKNLFGVEGRDLMDRIQSSSDMLDRGLLDFCVHAIFAASFRAELSQVWLGLMRKVCCCCGFRSNSVKPQQSGVKGRSIGSSARFENSVKLAESATSTVTTRTSSFDMPTASKRLSSMID